MLHHRWPIGLLVLCLAAPAPGADEAFHLQLKDNAEGDVLAVDDQTAAEMRVAVTDAAGKKLSDKADKTIETFIYRETILERKSEDKQPRRLKRQYEKAQVKVGDKIETLPYQGKVVLIERKDNKYRFRIEEGDELTGKEADKLDKEFNRSDEEALDHRLFLPDKPVRLNQEWKVNVGPLVKDFEKRNLTIDAAGVSATGKLQKVYLQDGHRFGVLDIHVVLPLKSGNLGKEKLAFQAGSQVKMDMTLDACVDGSSETGELNGTVRLQATGRLTAPDGKQYTTTMSDDSTVRTTRKELPKPAK